MQGEINLSGKAIKICFIAPKAYSLFNPDVKELFGGAEVDLYLLATELAKDENFAISFITANYGQEQTEEIEGVKVIKSLDFKKNPLIGAVRIWQAFRRADADMYMIKTISTGVFLVAFFCRLYKKTFLYRTAHSTHCDGTYLKLHLIKGRIFKLALRTAKLVFAQNETDKENLKRTTGVSSIALPNGHKMGELTEKQRNTILWVGRSARFKRPELFVNLAEKMPDEQFTMICQCATDDNKYEEFVARTKQVKNLEFIERVGFDEIDGYFQRAKVFVNTSDAEGFPNTFIQACKSATPILSLKVNPDGFLSEYGCGICCDCQLEKLVDSLNFILEENRYKNMGMNARKYAEECHDITNIIEQYKTVFINSIQNKF
jgi:glycosyltransferase involved in cell wall biosynthesis